MRSCVESSTAMSIERHQVNTSLEEHILRAHSYPLRVKVGSLTLSIDEISIDSRLVNSIEFPLVSK